MEISCDELDVGYAFSRCRMVWQQKESVISQISENQSQNTIDLGSEDDEEEEEGSLVKGTSVWGYCLFSIF